jgi:uncharacterized protein YbjT (DUF2867 family)
VILIVGGTGLLGRELVPLLLAEGRRVRVLTRDPSRAAHLPSEVEIVTGDLRNAADLAAAVAGCTSVVSAAQGFAGPGNPSPESIDRDGNRALIHAATEARVGSFVLLSAHGASADHPMSLHRAKHAAEEAVRASGVPFTIIRATAFLERWRRVIGDSIRDKGHALVFGQGKNPINFVSVRDVAALVALALRDDSLRGETLEIGGPQNIDFVTFAERLIEASGKPARIKHIPLPVLRIMSVLARPFSPMFARQAGAAVVMNTIDMTCDVPTRERFPMLPSTRLADVLAQR